MSIAILICDAFFCRMSVSLFMIVECGVPLAHSTTHDIYMVMTSLAWNLKAWFGLLLPNSQRGLELIKMEFPRFLHAIVLLPAQIVRTGRRIIYRIMSYNRWLKELFAAGEHLRWLRAT